VDVLFFGFFKEEVLEMTRESRVFVSIGVAFCVLLVLGSSVHKLHAELGRDTLFGTDASGGNLITIDQGTGLGAIVGPMFAGVVPSLATDPTTGIIYAGQGGGAPNLYTVSPVTGLATFVGNSGLGVAAIGGMDFAADGTLFAAVNIAGDGGTGSDHLATINKATGQATIIGPFGACVGIVVPSFGGGSCTIEGIEAIAFDQFGTLWGAKTQRGAAGAPGLYTINPFGAATFATPILDAGGIPPSGGVTSLQFRCDGTLFGGTARGIGGPGGDLITINPATGLFSFVGPVSATGGPSLGALAFENTCSSLDPDMDGILTPDDNCPFTPNPSQADNDADGTGNACDACINDFGPPDNAGCPRPEVPPGTEVSNDPSACDIEVDGRFGSNACVEWDDITPVVSLEGESVIYQSLDPDGVDLYLMYDFIGSQTPLEVGEESGVVRFFVGDDVFDVSFIQGGPSSTGPAGDDVRVLRNGLPFDDSLGSIKGAVDFNNTSPNFAPPHNLFELEVVLLQTPDTPGGLPPGGGGLYSPDPAFWGASLPGSPLVQVSANVIDIQAGGNVVAIVSNMIDIKPGSDPNAINTKSMGVVPVAILGSETFDAAEVDVTTLTFGPAGASPTHGGHLEDVNSDGFTDLVSHYRQKETGLAQGDMQACINGQTNGGEPIFGCDSVFIVR